MAGISTPDVCRKRHFDRQGADSALNGGACCYLGLAYNLYLLEHNVELQERYLARLKNRGNFPGAYYELIVAGVLIRAGFLLALEDETDDNSKHCEFSAISSRSSRKYWVEAKMSSVEGILGKTALDGVSQRERDPTSRMTSHIREALMKPAEGERLIFVDLNAEIANNQDGAPAWMEQAVRRLDARERDLLQGQSAYVFVTNLPFHRYPNDDAVGTQVFTYGLGIPDFSKPGYRTLIEAYKNKQKHLDAHDILESFKSYPSLPTTFDGSLPSDAFGEADRNIKIGERYFFEGREGAGVVAKVTSACVIEKEKKAYITILTNDEKGMIITTPLTADQLADYKRHPDVFFGEISAPTKNTTDPFEFFEWMLGVYKNTSKEKLLEFMAEAHDIDRLRMLSQEELAMVYCERHSITMLQKAAPEKLRYGPARPG